MIGVSTDPVEKNLRFAEKHEFPYALLSDTEREMSLAYKACETAEDAYARRITYVVDAGGKIEMAIETGNPGDQAAELLKALSQS